MQEGRLQSLRLGHGGLEISTNGMPGFLLEANAAVRDGEPSRAAGLLCDANINLVERIIQEHPDRTDLMYVLAKLLRDVGQLDRAEPWLLRIVEREPHPVVYNDLGHIAKRSWARLTEASEHFRRASDLDSDHPDYWMDLGTSLILMGRVEEGLGWLERAVERCPDHPVIRPMWVWNRHYVLDDREFFFEQYKVMAQGAYPITLARSGHRNGPDPDRRLRIGFISPDFRCSPAGMTFEPVLDGLSRNRLELFGYGNVPRPDEMTSRMTSRFDVYRPVYGLDDGAVADLIERDGIDILVEIGGFCQDHRIGVLAHKPAPIQVDLGGLCTLGLPQIDYTFTDDLLDTPSLRWFYVEEPISLPGGEVSFRPPLHSPGIGPLPYSRNGFVTFGVFNNTAKITSGMVSLWASILRAAPDAHLVFKAPALADGGIRRSYLAEFHRQGVSSDRIQMHGRMEYGDHLSLLSQVDLALDTYPYNGCVTTLECLWMGVPTISRTGQTRVARQGADILSRVGLEVFLAESPEEYAAKASAFARQPQSLAVIRASLRRQMLSSPLCDPNRIGCEMEQAFRSMWRRWCESPIKDQRSKIKNEEGGR